MIRLISAARLKPSWVPTSISLRSTLRTPATMFMYTGKKEPMAIRVTFDTSSIPSQISSRGTQARPGTARRAWKVGSSQASSCRLMPTRVPISTARPAPMPKPSNTRWELANIWVHSGPPASSRKVISRSLGAGISQAGSQPRLTLSSRRAMMASGSSRPTGVKRSRRTADHPAIGSAAAPWVGPECSWCRVLNHAFGDIGRQQGIQGALDVGRAAQDVVGLKQGNDRPDRVQVGLTRDRTTEVIAGQLQADHLDRQAGFPGDQVSGLLRVGDDPLACPLIGPEYGLDGFRLLAQHPFAGIEEGAQAEFRVAIDEAGSACFRSGHVRIESGPDIHAPLLQCGATLGVLQVHDAYVPGAETMAL